MLRDEVEYEPPLGALGRLLGGALIRGKLDRMFDYRHEVTRRVVESGDLRPGPIRAVAFRVERSP